MNNANKKRCVTRKRRILRVRKKLKGSAIRPRLCVNKSNKNIFAQLIDDDNAVVIASESTLSIKLKKSKSSSKEIGIKIAKKAKDKKIDKVIFDRGRFKYHGLIASLAEGAREGGLEF